MASSARYTAAARVDNAVAVTAEVITTGLAATNATVAIPFTAGATDALIDKINIAAVSQTAASVAGQLGLWLCKGDVGKTISSLTSATTTATVTTATAHGLITGDLVTVQGCTPIEYNVKATSITVTSATAFTYTITSVSGVAANTIGYYSSTHVAPQYEFIKDIPITAVTPSTTVSRFNSTLCSKINVDFLPLIVPAGWSLRATVNATQTSNGIGVTVFAGDF